MHAATAPVSLRSFARLRAGRCGPGPAACYVRRAVAPAAALRRACTSPCRGVRGVALPARRRAVACAAGLEGDDVGNMLPINMDSDEGIGGTSDHPFGPDAVLLVGFLRDEVPRIRAVLDDIGADFVRVVLATRDMLDGTLGEALEAPAAAATAKPATGCPRVLFCSGMSGAEVMQVIAALEELALPPCVFAAAVPRSVGKRLADVLDEIAGDAERLGGAVGR